MKCCSFETRYERAKKSQFIGDDPYSLTQHHQSDPALPRMIHLVNSRPTGGVALGVQSQGGPERVIGRACTEFQPRLIFPSSSRKKREKMGKVRERERRKERRTPASSLGGNSRNGTASISRSGSEGARKEVGSAPDISVYHYSAQGNCPLLFPWPLKRRGGNGKKSKSALETGEEKGGASNKNAPPSPLSTRAKVFSSFPLAELVPRKGTFFFSLFGGKP